MTRRTAALALVGVAVLAACGGDDDGGPSATPGATETASVDAPTYYANLEEALTQVNGQLVEVERLRDEAFAADGSDGILAYAQAYEDYVTARDEAVLDLPAPPAELAENHAALLSATAEALAFGQTLNTRIQEDPPANESELSTLLQELEGPNATQSYRFACSRLQIAANSSGAEIDLQCLR